MATLQDKSLNNGGRVDPVSKLMGGMQFRDNAQATVIAVQNTWYAVGTGAVGHAVYSPIVPVAVTPNFTVSGTQTNLQRLVFTGAGKVPTYVRVDFGVTALIPAGGTISNIEYRLQRTDLSGTTSTVATGSVGAAVLGFRFPGITSTVAPISPGDQLFLEIRNITAVQNITVVEALVAISQ